MNNLKELIKNSVVERVWCNTYDRDSHLFKLIKSDVYSVWCGIWFRIRSSVRECVKNKDTWKTVNKPSVLKSLQNE